MPAEITMPKLGLTMETGTIVRWLKGPGERIVVGDPLLEVSTDKINYEVESPVGGTLTQHLGNDGEEFACGAVIGLVALDDEHVTLAASASPVSVGAPRAEPASLPPASGTPAGNGSRKAAVTGSRRPASPAARKLARELHVDVATVSGSGPRGRVTLSDVLAVAPAATSEPRAQPGTAALPPDLDRARRTIFRRMSDVGILPLAQVETSVRVDELRALMKRRDDFGWTAFAVCALARLLREHPLLATDARTGRPHETFDIGVAADTPQGLVVPVVRAPHAQSLASAQREIVRLAQAAREGKLTAADVGGAAISISNVGPQGVERVVPLVDPPQTAILGMGAVARKPAVAGDALVPAWILTLVLSFDHRFIDGAPAARFLAALARAFADPAMLL